jgi:hypothetical protein
MRAVITINKDCIGRMQKQGPEVVALANGDTLEFRWSEKSGPLSAQTIGQDTRGAGCFVQIEE